MHKQAPGHHAWNDIDGTTDPHWFVRYLESRRTEKLKMVEADPQKFFDHLDIQEGQHLLEIGCGTGDLLGALGRLVGSKGHVMGIDISETMIAEACKRIEGIDLPVVCRVGDAYRLEFASNSFDRCYASAVFQHLGNPEAVLREIIRVTKPGGIICITEQDWQTQIIDADDLPVTRRILDSFCKEIINCCAGRRLPAQFQELGLIDIVVIPITFVSTDYAKTDEALDLRSLVERAQEAGIISVDEGAAWLCDLEQRGRTGRFFRSVTTFRVRGRKRYPVYF